MSFELFVVMIDQLSWSAVLNEEERKALRQVRAGSNCCCCSRVCRAEAGVRGYAAVWLPRAFAQVAPAEEILSPSAANNSQPAKPANID